MCGLAGIISTNKTEFNVDHFNILGTLNDERGGDSCGIFIDGQVDYGIRKKELFRDFMNDTEYPKSASIALLHCRKASPGYVINLNQAQPIIIKDNNNKIDFVLMHNGTISNIKDLATKYLPKVNTYHMSDSQILAKIIYEFGYDVLEEYEGCAVLIMVDYRSATPQVLMFKGSSCYNEDSTKSERPLYYMVNNDKFYFSSMYTSLYCINHKKTIYDFPINQLCRVKNNIVYLVKGIDRAKLKKITYASTTVYNSNYTSSYDPTVINNICYDHTTGLYLLNNLPAHGEIRAYPSGYVMAPHPNSLEDGYFYFFNGRLLYNKECYEFLKSIDDLFEETVLMLDCPEVIDFFAYSPRKLGNELKIVDSKFNYINCPSRDFVTLFTGGDKIRVSNGVVTKVYVYPSHAVEIFKENTKQINFNFEELEKRILTFISSKLVNQDVVQ